MFLFFGLAFVLSWSVWVGLYRAGLLGVGAAVAIGTWGPTVAAIALTAATSGVGGVRELARRLLIWKVHPGWYAFALFVSAGIVVVALIVHGLLGGTIVEANDPAQWYLVFPALAQIFFFGVLGEELGWRGYATPRLQRRLGPLAASLIVGVAWGVWHLPLWWMEENFHRQIPFLLFLLNDVALAVVLTWLWNTTGGSLLLVGLLHAASNLTIGVAPLLPEYTGGSVRPLWISVGLLSAVAIVIAALWVRDAFAGETLPKR